MSKNKAAESKAKFFVAEILRIIEYSVSEPVFDDYVEKEKIYLLTYDFPSHNSKRILYISYYPKNSNAEVSYSINLDLSLEFKEFSELEIVKGIINPFKSLRGISETKIIDRYSSFKDRTNMNLKDIGYKLEFPNNISLVMNGIKTSKADYRGFALAVKNAETILRKYLKE